MRRSARLCDAYGSRAADIHLRGVRVGKDNLLGPEGGAGPVLERVIDQAIAAVASEAVGAMASLVDMTLDYLKTRQQFGKPIGTNQALQHRMVDMYIALDEARSMALYGALMLREPDELLRRRALSATKIEIDRTARRVGQEAVQLHGAMGVTEELSVGHYFKRLTDDRDELRRSQLASAAACRITGPERGMNLDLSAHEQAFEAEVRDFISRELPADIREKVRLDRHLGREDFMRWQQILGRKGWFTGAWPREHGGQAWTPVQTIIFNRVAGEMHGPELQVFGPAMVGPVIYSFGTEAQKAQHLPAIRDSSVWWCQGYSEPGSGSDLAALQTAAEADGDDYFR